jgi:hypothetical protein
MAIEQQGFGDIIQATYGTSGSTSESVGMEGAYHVECRDAEGNLKWIDTFPNLVNAVGKQLLFNTILRTLGGSTYSTVGPFLGLISGVSPSAPFGPPTFAAADTMTNHLGWAEFTTCTVGGSPVRGTAVFAPPFSSGTTPTNVTRIDATAITFTIVTGGLIGGCFLVTGTGAVNTQSDTNGTLYSAGAFAVARDTAPNDTVTVTYSTTATS